MRGSIKGTALTRASVTNALMKAFSEMILKGRRIMKWKSGWSLLLVLILAMTLTSAGQEQGTEKPEIQNVPSFVYFCLQHKGPIEDIQDVITRLIQAMQSQNLYPMGPMVGIYYGDANAPQIEITEWEIGFPVTEQAMVQPPLIKKEWTHTEVARALHIGPYEECGKTIVALLGWMGESGYIANGPVLERYMDMDPSHVKPENLRTEIWIPCRKK